MAARVIVVGNEKGGAGKSTLAIHLTSALLHGGAKVGLIDLDLRQQSMGHFFASRRAWLAHNTGVVLPEPQIFSLASDSAALSRASADEKAPLFNRAYDAAITGCDFVIIDTPGGDTSLSRTAHGRADLIVTPLNDSFVDFDMLGTVDPVTLDLLKPSLYSETVWNSRKLRAASAGKSIDWVVVINRMASTEARNRKRLEERMATLAKRVGFRIGPGLRDRVIYRELFPFGLTIADLSAKVRPVPVSLQHVAARQELRGVMHALGLSEFSGDDVMASA
ncbi:division plane-positioning ATPase MipZ [soil metagenome]